MSVRGVDDLLQQYRNSRVTVGPVSDPMLVDEEAPHHFMVSSLARAKDSCLLCRHVEAEISELLNESELPHPKTLIFPLSWSCLLGMCRVGWFFGYRSNAPGLTRDLERAEKATSLLIERANQYHNVYIIGHGIMNRLIVRELKKRDWHSQSRTGNGYWSRTVMVCTSA